MKKLLLMTAMMIGLSSLSYAQQARIKHVGATQKGQPMLKSSKKELVGMKVAPVSAKSVKSFAPMTKDGRISRRAYEDGVYYQKPQGTFYVGGTTQEDETFAYIMVAPFSNTVFKNMCTDKAAATWSINGTAAEGDEANDFDWGWVPANDGVFYAPTITSGSTSYTFCESLDSKGLIATNDIYSLSQINDGLCTTYYAWSEGYGYGPETDEYDGTTIYMGRVAQSYPKPEKPLYVDDIWFYYYTASETMTPLPEGVTMNVIVLEFDDAGENVVNRYIMPLTAENFHPFTGGSGTQGYAEVSYVGEDELGFETSAGFVLNGPFSVLIDGFEQEGVDFGLFLTDVSEDPYEAYFNGGSVEPTVMYYYDAEGNYVTGSWYYNPDKKAQYNAPIYIDGMFDVVSIEEFENVEAPAEGGELYAVIEDEAYYPQVYTTLDWTDEETGEANYTIEDLPSWITFDEAVVPTNADEHYKCYLLKMTAQPLTEGSRTAQIRIVSKYGADSGIMTVTQTASEPVEPDYTEVTIASIAEAAEEIANAKLTITDGKVLYANGARVFVREGNKAALLYALGIDDLKTNASVNGTIMGKITIYNNLPEFCKTDATNADGLTIIDTDVPAEPLEIDMANASNYVSDLVKFSGVTFTEVSGKNAVANLGSSSIKVFDQFGVFPASLEGTYDMTGIITVYKENLQIYPTEIKGATGISNINTDQLKDAPAYNVAGQRVNKNFKGLVVKDGRKFMNK